MSQLSYPSAAYLQLLKSYTDTTQNNDAYPVLYEYDLSNQLRIMTIKCQDQPMDVHQTTCDPPCVTPCLDRSYSENSALRPNTLPLIPKRLIRKTRTRKPSYNCFTSTQQSKLEAMFKTHSSRVSMAMIRQLSLQLSLPFNTVKAWFSDRISDEEMAKAQWSFYEEKRSLIFQRY